MAVDLDNLVFIALGTRRKPYDSDGNIDKTAQTTIGAPFKVYAIDSVDTDGIGYPPYYRIHLKDGNIEAQILYTDSAEYNRVKKWVGSERDKALLISKYKPEERLVLKHPSAGCIIGKDEAKELLEGSEMFALLLKLIKYQ